MSKAEYIQKAVIRNSKGEEKERFLSGYNLDKSIDKFLKEK